MADNIIRSVLGNRQPPTGETSLQIPPHIGDVTQEAVRLSSYRNFPDSVPVSASRMARAGFYYSGTGDRVVCFSCSGGVEGWEYGDTAMGEHGRLYPHCDFVNGSETRNKPLLPPPGMFQAAVPQAAAAPPPAGRDYADFLSPAQQDKLRRKEADLNDNNDNNFRQPPSTGANVTNLGRSDNKNSAQGRDNPDSMPTIARQNFVTQNVNHLLSNTNTGYDVTDPGPGTPHVHERDIDPREQYKSEQRRLDSYVTWPAWAPFQPQELAKAGFFYTGSDDRVQCFCCQGILRNWEAGDRAMNEHRRHFPSCPFVLNFNVGNIPIEDQDPNLPPSIQQSSPTSPPASQSSGLYQTARLYQPGLQVTTYRASRPQHPQMADEQIRLSSFHLWPSSTAVAAQHLAKAGFFYTNYDALLPWPFRQKVTLMLLDQDQGRRNLSDTFRPDPTSSSFKRPTSDMNIASGCPLFVSQAVVEGGFYLKDDTIFIKVIVETSDLMGP
ncbi:Baculoviral IAP repeat-containing protein 2 [Branchiostoma belcheri]|nr:Baculoviral IAP repeat-containing protein 2 [Branchiostoma belcheri]